MKRSKFYIECDCGKVAITHAPECECKNCGRLLSVRGFGKEVVTVKDGGK
jgi:hypothetical protein